MLPRPLAFIMRDYQYRCDSGRLPTNRPESLHLLQCAAQSIIAAHGLAFTP